MPLTGPLPPAAGANPVDDPTPEGRIRAPVRPRISPCGSGMKSRVQRARRNLKAQLSACCRVRTDPTGALAADDPNPGGCGCTRRHPRRGRSPGWLRRPRRVGPGQAGVATGRGPTPPSSGATRGGDKAEASGKAAGRTPSLASSSPTSTGAGDPAQGTKEEHMSVTTKSPRPERRRHRDPVRHARRRQGPERDRQVPVPGHQPLDDRHPQPVHDLRLLRRHAGDGAHARSPSSTPTTPPSWSARTTADPGRVPAARHRRLPDRRHRQHRRGPRRQADRGHLHRRRRHRPARHPRALRRHRSATATSRSRSPSTSRATPTTRSCAVSSSSPASVRPSTTC